MVCCKVTFCPHRESFNCKITEIRIVSTEQTNMNPENFSSKRKHEDEGELMPAPDDGQQLAKRRNSDEFETEQNETHIEGSSSLMQSAEDNISAQAEYCSKLKALNIAFTDWIKLHVDDNPQCILTNVFDDYKEHLRKIFREKKKRTEKLTAGGETPFKIPPVPISSTSNFAGNSGTIEPRKADAQPITVGPTPPGDATSSAVTDISAITWSFDNDAPPFKADEVVGEPAHNTRNLFIKRCQIIVERENGIIECGDGTLFVNKMKDSHIQIMLRADASHGNSCVNMTIVDGPPVTRDGESNVTIDWIPTAKAGSIPESVLFRFETAEEADELLSAINKRKL